MLTPEQDRAIRDRLRALDVPETCPLCDAGRWTLDHVWVLDAIKRTCARCGHILLFDSEPFGFIVGLAPGGGGNAYAGLRPITDSQDFKAHAGAVLDQINDERVRRGLEMKFVVDAKVIAAAILPHIQEIQRASLARCSAAGGTMRVTAETGPDGEERLVAHFGDGQSHIIAVRP